MAPSGDDIALDSEEKLKLYPRGALLDLTAPVVMGVLNVTPDSFSDGGRFNEVDRALQRIEVMVQQGATIIDIGGESTRPGADPVDENTELQRVLPVLEQAVPQYPDHFFSVDTRKYKVAREALDRGTHIINDVSGLQKEPRLAELAASYDAALILMHSQGDPQNMQDNPTYDEVVEDIRSFLRRQTEFARDKGLSDIIVDPGIGFGKKIEHNLTLFARFESFKKLGCPLLIGASRKSMFDEILNGRPARERVAATVAAHYDAMMHGASVLRVHDVQEAYDSIKVFNAIEKIRSEK